MKILMRVVSGFLALVMVFTILVLLFPKNLGTDFIMFTSKCLYAVVLNLLPIISIALCCFCMERGDSNPFIKIIPIYMLVGIGISTILIFNHFEEMTYGAISNLLSTSVMDMRLSGIADFTYKIYSFMNSTYLCITLICLLLIVQSNNVVSAGIKKVAVVTLILNIVLSVWLTAKAFMEENLPSIYDTESYYSENQYALRAASYSDTSNFVSTANSVALVIESFSVILLFITNYAFSSDGSFDATEVDYEQLKAQAENYSSNKMANMYTNKVNPQTITEPPRAIVKDASQTGIMNINNQLGNNSNVGQVSESAKTTNVVNTNSFEMSVMTQGPVINDKVQQAPTTPQPATIPPPQQQ